MAAYYDDVAIRGGHSPYAKGAMKRFDEQEKVRSLCYTVVGMLNSKGISTVDCNSNANSVNGELNEGTRKANNSSAQIYFPIHMDSFNTIANGVAAHLYDGSDPHLMEFAKLLCKNISTLGYLNRGIRYNPGLHDLRESAMPALLLETLFCDNEHDTNLYNEYEVAECISNAFLGEDMSAPKGPHWRSNDTGWWYVYENGTYPTDKWEYINGAWYYFKTSGYMCCKEWLKDGDYWYRFNSEGRMITGWAQINGNWYYFNEIKNEDYPTGAAVRGYRTEGVHTYYLNPIEHLFHECSMVTGWVQIDGKWRYFRKKPSEIHPSGTMVRADWIPSASDPSVLYFIKENGEMAEDEEFTFAGIRYFADKNGRTSVV